MRCFFLLLSFPFTLCFVLNSHNVRKKCDVKSSTDEVMDFVLDPTSELAQQIVVDRLGLTESQYEQMIELSYAVDDWNKFINLVSRKDCSPSTVFGRHILPSIACCAMKDNPIKTAGIVVDVGTGGGFPGLPLAIAYPETKFVLLDSVGKKLNTVKEIADSMGLKNVEIHHGRAEDLRGRVFDVATGRSVSAIPQFCVWMQHLLREESGRLMYIIGGDIDDAILTKTISDTLIEDLVDTIESDKRILVFSQSAVKKIAKESGIKVQPTITKSIPKDRPNPPQRNKSKVKGAWRKRDSKEPKKRGYEDFQRYSSM